MTRPSFFGGGAASLLPGEAEGAGEGAGACAAATVATAPSETGPGVSLPSSYSGAAPEKSDSPQAALAVSTSDWANTPSTVAVPGFMLRAVWNAVARPRRSLVISCVG